jgi:hypothetical protein
MKSFLRVLALGAISVPLLCGCWLFPIDAQGARAASGFESDADGWTVAGDAAADSANPDWNGTGGNPDGLITATDDVTGGTWYYVAPSRYLGDASVSYGKLLKYDLKTTSVANLFDNFDIVLEGGGITLVYHFTTPADPGTDTWTSYAIQLSETAGWKIADAAFGTADFAHYGTFPTPKRDQLQSVLANLTFFAIRGEFNSGADTGSLDNVRFGADY